MWREFGSPWWFYRRFASQWANFIFCLESLASVLNQFLFTGIRIKSVQASCPISMLNSTAWKCPSHRSWTCLWIWCLFQKKIAFTIWLPQPGSPKLSFARCPVLCFNKWKQISERNKDWGNMFSSQTRYRIWEVQESFKEMLCFLYSGCQERIFWHKHTLRHTISRTQGHFKAHW